MIHEKCHLSREERLAVPAYFKGQAFGALVVPSGLFHSKRRGFQPDGRKHAVQTVYLFVGVEHKFEPMMNACALGPRTFIT